MQLGILKEVPARMWLSVLMGGVVCLASWQVWLTVRLLEQDRNLELQRSRERLRAIADLAVAQLAGELADWDLGLRELNSLPISSSRQARFPKGTTFILISQSSVNVYAISRRCWRTEQISTPKSPIPASRSVTTAKKDGEHG